ncbi:protein N-terminal asparagine amidohydrolase isoform X3 [Lagopus muta]|uniref:protein N-terminal asparagine amidohydrolase isoform X3 n=1 Tax=Lagopus muta TaxID=64668 RepID=UPI0020A1B4CD|nr:protein N-terminal asparagine amidohydrolase isoform X3 [Lagopus muta]
MSGPLLSERAQTAACCRRPALSDFCRGFPALRAAAPDLAQRGPGEEERSGRLPPWAFSAMPLLINGERIDLTRLTGGVIRTHPHLEEKAKLLRSQPTQIVEPKGLLYVQQREFAVTTPNDGSVSILGSDDATTCHLIVLRHTGAFDLQPDDVHLVTFCVSELNDREEKDIHLPIIYGIAVNVKTAEIFPATFPEKGPDEDLRSAHVLTGARLTNIYDAKTEQLHIGPYFWRPFPHVDFWLEQDDQQILQNLSTSPLAEPPHFVSHIRSTLTFLKAHPFPSHSLFPDRKPRIYKKNEEGLWELVCSDKA